MKRTLLMLSAALTIAAANAQTATTVSVGASYANDVFYQLSDDAETSVSRTNWDIAITTSTYGTSIRTNDGNSTTLYVYGTDINQWNSVDTNGFDWSSPLYNPDTTWSYGAFSNFATSGMDYGWGTYNTATHAVTGNRIFLIELADGSMKKMMIDSMPGVTANAGHLFFTYADISGANEVNVDLDKSNYAGKNFAYYSIQNGQEIDREPASSDWDLLFTKYSTDLGGGTMYSVTGVLANGLNVMDVMGVDVSTSTVNDGVWSTEINTIGWDWKEFNMSTFQYDITADQSFFVEDQNGDIYKLVFTGFGGSSNGNYEFTKELVSAVSVEEEMLDVLSIYPNPATNNVTLTFNAQTSESVLVTVLDLSGKVVLNSNLGNPSGLSQATLDITHLPSGVYVVSVKAGNKVTNQKLVVNK